jgi:uncharacterized protein (DUF58 family)
MGTLSGYRWLIVTGFVLAAALVLESGLLAYAMYVLLGVMVFSRILARDWVGRLTASQNVSAREADVGDEIVVRVNVSNNGTIPVPWILLEHLLPPMALRQKPPRLTIKGRRLKLAMLRGGGEVAISYRIVCDYRGFYQVGPLLTESGDLFGLHRRHRVATEPVFLTVYPKVIPLSGYDIASRRPIGEVRLTHRLFEDPTRIAGVRPYQAGDPLNRVHWRATARTGELHSKIYEPTSLAGATILLDFHDAGYPAKGEPHRSELAVTAAVSLAHAVATLGQQVGLMTNGRDAAERLSALGHKLYSGPVDYQRRGDARQNAEMLSENDRLQPLIVPTANHSEQFHYIRELLARVELADGLPFAQFVIEITPRLPRDATVIAILPHVPEQTALALGNLRRSGFVVTVVLVMLDDDRLQKAIARLASEGIRDARHLVGESSLSELCQQSLYRGNPYSIVVDD